MGKIKGLYKEEFSVGTKVRIVERSELEKFILHWKWHNPLKTEQLKYAGKTATVKEVAFYHGGDELYVLKEFPGVWHEENLIAAFDN